MSKTAPWSQNDGGIGGGVHGYDDSFSGVNDREVMDVAVGHSVLQSNFGPHHDAPHAYVKSMRGMAFCGTSDVLIGGVTVSSVPSAKNRADPFPHSESYLYHA